MTESDEAQQDLKRIKWHLENLDNKVDMLVRGNSDAIEAVADVFRDDSIMAKVYLAVNGDRTQKEIADHIEFSEPTVHRRIDSLTKAGLVQKKEYDNGIIYMKDELHSVLRLDEKVDPKEGWNDK